MPRITAASLDSACKRVNGKLRDGLHVKIDVKPIAGPLSDRNGYRHEVALYDNRGFCNTLHIFKTNQSGIDFLCGMIDALSIVGR